MEKAAPSEVKLGIIGGDLRALTAARELAARGFEPVPVLRGLGEYPAAADYFTEGLK